MVNVNVMGYLHRVSDANFKRYLRAKMSSSPVERGGAEDYLGHDCGRIYNATDMGKEEASEMLQRYEEKIARRVATK